VISLKTPKIEDKPINIKEKQLFGHLLLEILSLLKNTLPLCQIYRSIAFGMPKEESPDNVENHTT